MPSQIVFSREFRQRLVAHSLAVITGVVLSARFGAGHAYWVTAGWFCVGIVAFYLTSIALVTAWIAVALRAERWVRAIVEEELQRYDLRVYGEQLRRLLPEQSFALEPVKTETAER